MDVIERHDLSGDKRQGQQGRGQFQLQTGAAAGSVYMEAHGRGLYKAGNPGQAPLLRPGGRLRAVLIAHQVQRGAGQAAQIRVLGPPDGLLQMLCSARITHQAQALAEMIIYPG